jgi:hypothetical protein
LTLFSSRSPPELVTGFLFTHWSVNLIKSQASHSGSLRTKSPRIPDSLSRVIDTFPLTLLILPIVSSAWTECVSLSQKLAILRGLAPGVVGKSKRILCHIYLSKLLLLYYTPQG